MESTSKVFVSKAKETISAGVFKKLAFIDAAQEFTQASNAAKQPLNIAVSKKQIKDTAETSSNLCGALDVLANITTPVFASLSLIPVEP